MRSKSQEYIELFFFFFTNNDGGLMFGVLVNVLNVVNIDF